MRLYIAIEECEDAGERIEKRRFRGASQWMYALGVVGAVLGMVIAEKKSRPAQGLFGSAPGCLRWAYFCSKWFPHFY